MAAEMRKKGAAVLTHRQGWATALTLVLLTAGAAIVLARVKDVPGDQLAGLIFVAITLLAIVLVLSSGEESRWVDVGRGLFVSGVFAVAVWAVDQLQQEFESRRATELERQDLRLAIGAQDDLTGIDLAGKDLAEFQLAGKNLTAADLRGARLAGANLRGTVLTKADLTGAILADADLTFATLTDANLTAANLADASLEDAVLKGANLSGANLSGVQFENAHLRAACLAGADLSGGYLPGAHLNKAVLTDATLDDATFEADFRPAVLRGTGLAGATALSTTWPADFPAESRIAPEPRPPIDLEEPEAAQRDKVVEIADGDTMALGKLGPARLIGIDAPAVDERFYEKSTRYTTRMLRRRQVTVSIGEEPLDEYGRTLVYVWLPSGRSFNAAIVQDGMATVKPEESNRRYKQEFERAQTRAKQLGSGLWRNCPGPKEEPEP